MLTKTKIALAAALVAGTASLAAAQEADPNLYNRYPAFNGPVGVIQQQGAYQSVPVGLHQSRQAAQSHRFVAPVESVSRDSAPLITGGGY
jgi:hypothetical protein